MMKITFNIYTDQSLTTLRPTMNKSTVTSGKARDTLAALVEHGIQLDAQTILPYPIPLLGIEITEFEIE